MNQWIDISELITESSLLFLIVVIVYKDNEMSTKLHGTGTASVMMILTQKEV